MAKDALVSVVIPFYKGGKYIDQCVRSVLEQPYKNIEILLINDGSPSGGEVCERIAKQYPEVKYYSKKNEGIGVTRNYGLMKASGDYIAFLDQDDVWVKGFLDENIVEVIQHNDITAFSHYCTNHQMTRGNRITLEDSKIIGGG